MEAKWEEDIRRFEELDRSHPPPPGAVLFVGSSSIAMWTSLARDFPSTAVINRGFGGSEVEDSLRYADRIIIPYKPRLIVLYAGDNDLASGKSPARVFADYRALVSKVHRGLPDARLAFISIKPSPARRHLEPQIRGVNERVKAFVAGSGWLAYIDVFAAMLGADGAPRRELFVEDELHMNAAGYALWREAVTPFLDGDGGRTPAGKPGVVKQGLRA
jgi:lysophospholipase L1-like esterase